MITKVATGRTCFGVICKKTDHKNFTKFQIRFQINFRVNYSHLITKRSRLEHSTA